MHWPDMSGFRPRAALCAFRSGRIQATASLGEAALGPFTVKRYLVRWIEDRRVRNVASAGDDETRLQRHALPELGELLLTEVRPSHIRTLVRSLKARVGQGRAQLAPRTVRHVYGVLHRMFEDEVADELIESNPRSEEHTSELQSQFH